MWQSRTSAPSGFTVAFRVAEVWVTCDAAPVPTAGALGRVLNVASAPLPLPPLLVATTRAREALFAARPANGPATPTPPLAGSGRAGLPVAPAQLSAGA